MCKSSVEPTLGYNGESLCFRLFHFRLDQKLTPNYAECEYQDVWCQRTVNTYHWPNYMCEAFPKSIQTTLPCVWLTVHNESPEIQHERLECGEDIWLREKVDFD